MRNNIHVNSKLLRHINVNLKLCHTIYVNSKSRHEINVISTKADLPILSHQAVLDGCMLHAELHQSICAGNKVDLITRLGTLFPAREYELREIMRI